MMDASGVLLPGGLPTPGELPAGKATVCPVAWTLAVPLERLGEASDGASGSALVFHPCDFFGWHVQHAA